MKPNLINVKMKLKTYIYNVYIMSMCIQYQCTMNIRNEK